MIQRLSVEGFPYSDDEGGLVAYDDHAAALAAEKEKVRELARVLDQLLYHAELGENDLYNVRFTKEGYVAFLDWHKKLKGGTEQ